MSVVRRETMKKWVPLIIAATLLVGATAMGARIGSGIVNIGGAVPEMISTAAAATLPPEPVTVTEQAMVEAIEHRLELTVAELSFTTSVETGTCGETSWQRFAWDDCLTMIVPGKVEVDLLLEGFNEESIETTERTVTITLPGVTVGDVILDHSHIRPVDYEQGLFVTDADPNLQGQGLAEARENLRVQACGSPLLSEENRTTADRVKNLLQPIFDEVGDSRTITVVLEAPTC
jgi:Protein of unknown function (DUF4230)